VAFWVTPGNGRAPGLAKIRRECVNAGVRLALVAHRLTSTNAALTAWPAREPLWSWLTPEAALATLVAGDVALGRLDVLPTLDGVDDGLWALGELEARGVQLLNGASALLACHDKHLTARLLEHAGLPHPKTSMVTPGELAPHVPSGAVVVKPRFGSWGQGVVRCDDPSAVPDLLAALEDAPWFRSSGALVQQLVPPLGYDLRVVVAGERAIGAITRVSPPGEWRTNVALGARRVATEAPLDARELAVRAAKAVGADLVGVDLLPDGSGGWTILELNGAVELTRAYARSGDVFALAATELARAVTQDVPARGSLAAVPSA
jgi:[lysine-biosynthesis-protein LysW]--L-2-aminoadipate ligase